MGAAELLLLFVGFTMFMRTWSVFQALLHFAGLLLVALFMDDHWPVGAFVTTFVFCSLMPFLFESSLALFAAKYSFQRW